MGEADARLESADRQRLAETMAQNIRVALVDYRQARSRKALIGSAVRAAVATAAFAALVVLVIWLSRRLGAALEKAQGSRIRSVGIQSFQVFGAGQILRVLRGMLSGARALLIIALGLLYLDFMLRLLPWTRGLAKSLLGYVLDPLATLAEGFANAIPDLLFLLVLFFVTRILLNFTQMFFAAVERGEVKIAGFEAEWALPTYKIVRIARHRASA